MSSMEPRSADYFVSLVSQVRTLPAETEWLEFKQNYADHERIGEYVSALANSAAILSRGCGYLIWGLADTDHAVVGTNFNPQTTRIGNEPLENWIARLLSPCPGLRFIPLTVGDKPMVLLEVQAAVASPVQFRGEAFIRVGAATRRLKDCVEKERLLWHSFEREPFDRRVAIEHVPDPDVLQLLDYPAYFRLAGRPLPEDRHGILHDLYESRLIRPCDAGGWDITNLGAVLFAARLDAFPFLGRKAVRVIQYRGTNRVETIREQIGFKGYAAGFEGLISFINGLLPANEVITQALRQSVRLFPELAVRELVANALIHQDFTISGTGPMVELFDDRIQITNPGRSLVATDRLVDCPARSRNEAVASLMRTLNICEERGSGWDKVIQVTELFQLPAPLAETTDAHTCVTLLSPRPLTQMDAPERVNAVYWHAVLRHVSSSYVTNTSVRERFRIEPQNSAQASRLIREAVDAGRIVPYDAEAGPKNMRYRPFWAAPPRSTASTSGT